MPFLEDDGKTLYFIAANNIIQGLSWMMGGEGLMSKKIRLTQGVAAAG
jgi:hypothetical protein